MVTGSNSPSGLSKIGLTPSLVARHVDGALLHQVLEALGQRGLAAADGAEEVKNLLLLLEALRRVTEEADDALDGLLEAVEVLEGRIDLERAVHEDAPEPRIPGRIDELRLSDSRDHTFCSAGIHRRIGATAFQVFLQRHPVLLLALVCLGIEVEDVFLSRHCASPLRRRVPVRLDQKTAASIRCPELWFACVARWRHSPAFSS